MGVPSGPATSRPEEMIMRPIQILLPAVDAGAVSRVFRDHNPPPDRDSQEVRVCAVDMLRTSCHPARQAVFCGLEGVPLNAGRRM
jgi:hypothetical protein